MKRLSICVLVFTSILFASECLAGQNGQGGNNNGQNNNNQGQSNVAAPEIHPAGAVAVATLLTGAFALLSARRRTN